DPLPELRLLRAWGVLFAGKNTDEGAARQAGEEVDALLRDRPAPDEGPYVLRAVSRAVQGRWKEAQADLQTASARAGGTPATSMPPLAAWMEGARSPAAVFLTATHKWLMESSRPEYAQRVQDVILREQRAGFNGENVFVLYDDNADVQSAFRR